MALVLADVRQGGQSPVAAPAEPAARNVRRLGPWVVYLFIFSLMLPAIVMVGPIRLSPYRVVLIFAFFPILYGLATGAWRPRVPDLFVVLYALWPTIAIIWHHGLGGGLEAAGIHVIESFGAYGLARCYVRSYEDFERILRVFLVSLVVLVPFALYESLTGHLLIWDLAGLISQTFSDANRETRMGLQRVHGPFQHAILYGVYCASLLGMLVLTMRARYSAGKLVSRLVLVGIATFLSLSSGPFVAFMIQIAMLGWLVATAYVPHRWWIFLAGVAMIYVTIDVLSNRSPFEVLISYGTFNQGNAYNRVHIWNFGTAEVVRQPFLGVGFNEWQNAHWMSQSIDNFWLYNAVRFGLPAFIFGTLAVLSAIFLVGCVSGLSVEEKRARTGWGISMVGLVIAGGTVHFWHALFVHFFLLLGLAMWVLDRPSQSGRKTAANTPSRGQPCALAEGTPRVLLPRRAWIMGLRH